MRDIYEIRRENLHTVLDDDFHGSRKTMAERLEFEQPALLSRYLSTRPDTAKNIGPNLARKIEQIARRPTNWMDTDHKTSREHFTVQEPSRHYGASRELDPDLMMQCMDVVRDLLTERGIPKSDPAWTEQSILTMALKLYQETEARDVSQRGLKKQARDHLEIPVAATSKKKR